jgi:hypothetical protein
MSISTWFEGQEKTIEISWSLAEFQVEVNTEKTLSSLVVKVENNNAAGDGTIYFDEFTVEEGTFLKDSESDITYVTQLDHTDVLPASIQHHLLADPYLHPNDSKVKVSANDTTAGSLNGKLVAGTGISLTEGNDAGNETLTIAATGSGSGITWEEITGATTAENNKGYFANNVSRVDIALPAIATVGFQFYVCGKGAGGWRVTQNAGQTQHTDYVSSKTGTDGYIESDYYLNNALIVCMTANTDWKVFTLSNLVVNDNT